MQNLEIIKKDGYAIVQLKRGKVNAINHQMVKDIRETITTLQADESIGGLILTGIPHFFSAGLDVIELYDYDETTMRQFLTDFSEMHVELVRFPKPLICAINGYSPAGGTVIALAADYRIMVNGDKYTIGLNEVAVNIQISENLVEAYAFWIGKALAHRYIMDGKLLMVKEALAAGLIDEAVSETELLPRAEQKMKHFLTAHPLILRNTKYKLRKSWLDNLNKNRMEELEQALQIWWSPEVRKRMKQFIDRLTKK
jgi:3,2-trans-enoyl-CoA isomerase